MGSKTEFNDTLKISKERGFPKGLTLERHAIYPELSCEFLGQEFEFWNNDVRLYNHSGTRVHLVEEMPDGKWLYWGHAMITSQTIENGKTKGKYRITRIHEPDYQKKKTDEESPVGKSYFGGKPEGLFFA